MKTSLNTQINLLFDMSRGTIIFAIVLIILWYFSAFYIAAPHDVHNMLFGGFGMTHEQHHELGVALFIASLIVVLVWVVLQKDEKQTEKVAA